MDTNLKLVKPSAEERLRNALRARAEAKGFRLKEDEYGYLVTHGGYRIVDTETGLTVGEAVEKLTAGCASSEEAEKALEEAANDPENKLAVAALITPSMPNMRLEYVGTDYYLVNAGNFPFIPQDRPLMQEEVSEVVEALTSGSCFRLILSEVADALGVRDGEIAKLMEEWENE